MTARSGWRVAVAESAIPVEFEEARSRAGLASRELGKAFEIMVELTDPVEAPHDQVAALLVAVSAARDHVQDARSLVDAKALAWLRENRDESGAHWREILVGDMKWWGERVKHVRCKTDVGAAGMAAARAIAWEQILGATFGDEEGAEAVLLAIRDLFRSIVSAGGLKEAATRTALGPDAYAEHFEEDWPDKLAGGKPEVKLGVANLRFVHRVNGGDPKDLKRMDAQTEES